MNRLRSFMLIAATALSAAACSDSTGPAGNLSGTYTLNTLGGQQTPAPLYYNNSQDHVEILGSQITLYADGTYIDNTRVQDTNYGPTTVYDDNTSGTWVLSGSTLSLQDRNDYTHVTTAFVSSNRLTIDSFAGYGVQAIYIK